MVRNFFNYFYRPEDIADRNDPFITLRMRKSVEVSGVAKLSRSVDGTPIQTYQAIPHPVPEPWRTKLVGLGKNGGMDKENDVPALLRLEIMMRQRLGVTVTRPVIKPVKKD